MSTQNKDKKVLGEKESVGRENNQRERSDIKQKKNMNNASEWKLKISIYCQIDKLSDFQESSFKNRKGEEERRKQGQF